MIKFPFDNLGISGKLYIHLHGTDAPKIVDGMCRPKENIQSENIDWACFLSETQYPYRIGKFGSYMVQCTSGGNLLGIIFLDPEKFKKYFTVSEEDQ